MLVLLALAGCREGVERADYEEPAPMLGERTPKLFCVDQWIQCQHVNAKTPGTYDCPVMYEACLRDPDVNP